MLRGKSASAMFVYTSKGEAGEQVTPDRVGEQKRVQQAVERYGQNIVSALQKFAGDKYVFQARCKKAGVLFDWVRGSPLEAIEKEFSHNPYQGAIQAGDVRRFADSTRFHLRSAYQIAMVVAPQSLCSQEEIESLLRQLEVGLPEEGFGFAENLGADRSRRIFDTSSSSNS